eukprot:CFRG7229T1
MHSTADSRPTSHQSTQQHSNQPHFDNHNALNPNALATACYVVHDHPYCMTDFQRGLFTPPPSEPLSPASSFYGDGMDETGESAIAACETQSENILIPYRENSTLHSSDQVLIGEDNIRIPIMGGVDEGLLSVEGVQPDGNGTPGSSIPSLYARFQDNAEVDVVKITSCTNHPIVTIPTPIPTPTPTPTPTVGQKLSVSCQTDPVHDFSPNLHTLPERTPRTPPITLGDTSIYAEYVYLVSARDCLSQSLKARNRDDSDVADIEVVGGPISLISTRTRKRVRMCSSVVGSMGEGVGMNAEADKSMADVSINERGISNTGLYRGVRKRSVPTERGHRVQSEQSLVSKAASEKKRRGNLHRCMIFLERASLGMCATCIQSPLDLQNDTPSQTCAPVSRSLENSDRVREYEDDPMECDSGVGDCESGRRSVRDITPTHTPATTPTHSIPLEALTPTLTVALASKSQFCSTPRCSRNPASTTYMPSSSVSKKCLKLGLETRCLDGGLAAIRREKENAIKLKAQIDQLKEHLRQREARLAELVCTSP